MIVTFNKNCYSERVFHLEISGGTKKVDILFWSEMLLVLLSPYIILE